MKGNVKKAIAVLTLLMVSLFISACNRNVDVTTMTDGRWDHHIQIDVFNDVHTGFIGIQPGWFGREVYERFNMSMNHIGAPDGDFELIFATRAAAGELGDLIFVAGARIEEVVIGGLVMDITNYVVNNMPEYNRQFPGAVARARTFMPSGNIYALPTDVSSQPFGSPAFAGTDVSRAPYLRFDAYMGIGAPTLNVLEDLLPTLAAMQAYMPYTESGNPTWGFSMFGDWDGLVMAQAEWFDQMYGFTRLMGPAALSLDPINQRVESRIANDGVYKRALRLLFNANQMGLVDPDSPTQTFDDVWAKFADGQVLFSWYNWLCNHFNIPERVHEGIGYMFVPIGDQNLLMPSINPNGGDLLVAIGPNAEDPARIIAFIDWFSSPEGHEIAMVGPRGLAWDMVGGEPVVTAFGSEAGLDHGGWQPHPVPEEWGGSTFEDGGFQGRGSIVNRWSGMEMNPRTGFAHDPRHWPSVHQGLTQIDLNWAARFGHGTMVDYLVANNMLAVRPPVDFLVPEEPSDLNIIRGAAGPLIQSTSWRMVFASNQAEFDSLWADMRDTVYGLGWQQLVDWEYGIIQQYFALQPPGFGG